MLTIYGKPDCPQCTASIKTAEGAGIAFTYIDVTADAEALKRIQALGYRQAPVCIAGDSHWSGFMPDKIKGLAK